jgi:hypothetical protein
MSTILHALSMRQSHSLPKEWKREVYMHANNTPNRERATYVPRNGRVATAPPELPREVVKPDSPGSLGPDVAASPLSEVTGS